MDECKLNDLLECSVCLDRLDTSSKALPCQHTFCRKCLESIVASHKELRCPECRVLVESRIEDLPPNVLLMRILEGMKSIAKPPSNSVSGTPVHQHSPPTQQQPQLRNSTRHVLTCSQPTTDRIHVSNKSANLVTNQPHGIALFDYLELNGKSLCFKKGDKIFLKKKVNPHTYYGEHGGKLGLFPAIAIKVIVPIPSEISLGKAVYDFKMTGDDEGCLAFNKGAVIQVIRQVDANWAEGRINDKVGIFPLAFVELNACAKSLLKLPANSQPSSTRVRPPTPTTEEITPLIEQSSAAPVVCLVSHPPTSQAATHTSDSSSTISSSSPSTTPNTSLSNTSSTTSTAPSSPTSLPRPVVPQTSSNTAPSTTPNNPIVANYEQINKIGKRFSIESRNRHSVEIVSGPIERNESTSSIPHVERHRRSGSHDMTLSETSATPLSTTHSQTLSKNAPVAYIALYSYKPQKPDELELQKGYTYIVTERCQDGWYKGTATNTQKCGVFPGNYVVPAKIQTRSLTTSFQRLSLLGQIGGSWNDKSETETNVMKTPMTSVNGHRPELPPRSTNPVAAPSQVSCSWHEQRSENQAALPLGRSRSAVMPTASKTTAASTSATHTVTSSTSTSTVKSAKTHERKGKKSLMQRLANRAKSPPSATYSMDNPVFEDNVTMPTSSSQAVHVRSGSCPSQLLQVPIGESSTQNPSHHLLTIGTQTSSGSQRHKQKQRSHIDNPFPSGRYEGTDNTMVNMSSSHQHRKSNSLDAGSKAKSTAHAVERFRCIVPYPPNSEYELELREGDIVHIQKKRGDGWYKGVQMRTGKTGLFPASFVERINNL